MRKGACLAVIVALAGASAAPAGNPRAERKQLRKADMALAARGLLRRSDFVTGWRQTRPSSFDSEDQGGAACNPDVSRFTITGRAHSAVARAPGSKIESEVDIFKSVADARGDFRVGSSVDLAKCAEAATKADPGIDTSIKETAGPRLGERTFRYRVVISVRRGSRRVVAYVDVIAFQRGRAIGFLGLTSLHRPLGGGNDLAEVMAARLPA